MLALTLAVFLAIHTLALTYWQSLFDAISPGEDINGSILAGAYATSAVAAWLPSCTSVDALCSRLPRLLSVLSTLLCGLLLVTMGRTSSLAVAAGCFVVYHALAEAAMVVLNAQLARRVAAIVEGGAGNGGAAAAAQSAGVDEGPPAHAAAAGPEQGHATRSPLARAPAMPLQVPLPVSRKPTGVTVTVHLHEVQRHGLAMVHATDAGDSEAHYGDYRPDAPLLPAAPCRSSPDGLHASGAHGGNAVSAHSPAKLPARARFASVFGSVTLLSQVLMLALQYSMGATGAHLPLPTRYVVCALVVFGLGVILMLDGCAATAKRRACPSLYPGPTNHRHDDAVPAGTMGVTVDEHTADSHTAGGASPSGIGTGDGHAVVGGIGAASSAAANPMVAVA